jgi:predicted NAD/FAD-binding protein
LDRSAAATRCFAERSRTVVERFSWSMPVRKSWASWHEHYKVHWDERHESIVYPADGVQIIHKKSH